MSYQLETSSDQRLLPYTLNLSYETNQRRSFFFDQTGRFGGQRLG
jgi:hypothetical protein